MLDWTPIWITLRLAAITTLILLILSVPLSYWLAFTQSKLKSLVATLVSMPLVLPPTVIGFYLLVAFSPNNFLGSFLQEWFGLQLIFSFQGLVLASVIYSLPFMVQPLQSGFINLPINLSEAAMVLGSNKRNVLFKILLPNIRPSILTGIVLTFAHTLGEFGVVLMIGGNIPDKTRVASIAIYDAVESLNYGTANQYSIILFAFAFIILFGLNIINGGKLSRLFHGKN